MSETESEGESDLDFSASEDEYIPTDEEDSDEEEETEDAKDSDLTPHKSSKKYKRFIQLQINLLFCGYSLFQIEEKSKFT